MSRDTRFYLQDILDACEKVQRYTAGMSRTEFERDERTYDAVVRNLEVIGEASKHIDENLRARIPSVDWRKMAGLRDFLAHAYFGINDDILWDVVSNRIPALRSEIGKHIDNSEESSP